MSVQLQFSATRRGARLARLLATEQLRAWGIPYEAAAQVVGELAANAVLHGCVSGRDFRLSLGVPAPGRLLVEVTDTRGDRAPVPAAREADAGADGGADREVDGGGSGRGLVLVAALAERWGVTFGPVPRKSVWALLAYPAR